MFYLKTSFNTRKYLKFTLLLVAITLGSSLDQYARADGKGRTDDSVGVFATALSDSFFVGSLGYNLTNLIRLHAGYGQKTYSATAGSTTLGIKVTLIDVGAKLLVPGWSFSPFLGADYFIGSASTTYQGTKYTASASGLAPTIGLDYQASYGLNIGAIIYVGTVSGAGAYLGWYFL